MLTRFSGGMPVAVAEKITYTATAEQIESMHNAFDSALEELRGGLGQTYPLLIGGEERSGRATCAAVRRTSGKRKFLL